MPQLLREVRTMTYLRFADYLVEDVLDGSKRITARWNPDRDINPGDLVDAVDSTDTAFAQLEIVHVTPVPARRFVTLVDVIGGHQAYEDVDELIVQLEALYFTREGRFDPETRLHVIFFDVVDSIRTPGTGTSAADQGGASRT